MIKSVPISLYLTYYTEKEIEILIDRETLKF